MLADWNSYYCEECEDFGHPPPGTPEWDEFCREVDEEKRVLGLGNG